MTHWALFFFMSCRISQSSFSFFLFFYAARLYYLYVCIEVALRGDAHGIRRSNWLVGPISQPRGTNGTASLTLDHTCALMCAF